MTIDPLIILTDESDPKEPPKHLQESLERWAEDVSITNQYRLSVLSGTYSSDEVIQYIADLRDIDPEAVEQSLLHVGYQLRYEATQRHRMLK